VPPLTFLFTRCRAARNGIVPVPVPVPIYLKLYLNKKYWEMHEIEMNATKLNEIHRAKIIANSEQGNLLV